MCESMLFTGISIPVQAFPSFHSITLCVYICEGKLQFNSHFVRACNEFIKRTFLLAYYIWFGVVESLLCVCDVNAVFDGGLRGQR